VGYFQEVVTEYLRADRAVFVNTECLIQLHPNDISTKGAHWYCDAVAVNFREESVHLCEVSYSTTLQTLGARLQTWAKNWPALCAALVRESHVPKDFKIEPWVFIPKGRHEVLNKRLAAWPKIESVPYTMPTPRVTYLEDVAPWQYPTWDRKLTAIASDLEKGVTGDA
jgi:hypothetical protein